MPKNLHESNFIPRNLVNQIKKDDQNITKFNELGSDYPNYDPKTHHLELTKAKYYHGLIILRHYLKASSDYYFSVIQNAKNIDLFMLTPSISSPMGSGSDSEPISIQFGNLQTYLTDSSQFGFEPLLLNGFEKVYCYLPSMRGEDPDKRHLNQFFHCEAEIVGDLEDLIPIIEDYIKTLAFTMLSMPEVTSKLSLNAEKSLASLDKITKVEKFQRITFDEAVLILTKNSFESLIVSTTSGRDITAKGEVELMKILNTNLPIWITDYDRDRVPFYQKPNPKNTKSVINGDLIFPSLIKESFGGEIVGAGQRQDDVQEIYESLKRQNVSSESYEWYINIRKLNNYKTTSGFGIGIERFITWALCRDDIKEAILYPRLKNVKTLP